MIAAREMQAQQTKIVRYFLIYPDFRVRVDDNSPVHYDAGVRRVDSQGMNWVLTFRILALDRKGRLIVFEHKWPHSYLQTVQRSEVLGELNEEYAEPLNALPGRLEVR
ncbi:MAG TPA: hypothetical protein VFE91_06430 [Nitrososphaerales archaeon]|nr:hypothetical protein [Nitrososphaerales archaeon]